MKVRTTSFFILAILFGSSCRNKHSSKRTIVPTAFIPTDSANKMISSYLNSLDSPATGDDLQSLVIDMDQLRLYDTLTGAKKIQKIKIMFAHTLDYINSGHGNQYAGYKSDALTVVLAGVDVEGNYVYFQDNMVVDHSTSCPHNCPAGNAANPLLTNQ